MSKAKKKAIDYLGDDEGGDAPESELKINKKFAAQYNEDQAKLAASSALRCELSG